MMEINIKEGRMPLKGLTNHFHHLGAELNTAELRMLPSSHYCENSPKKERRQQRRKFNCAAPAAVPNSGFVLVEKMQEMQLR
ncbi:hypothetical protein HPP92_018315 [Vanilla planifolia]|uniref:Uncharacterized protein n=1 Tax=Vanilla planifolia TaxID=51239 RepID=A0A835QJR7_VANPL|nr:hypothetical protein HPP92_018315 [Vanilla planifolia]